MIPHMYNDSLPQEFGFEFNTKLRKGVVKVYCTAHKDSGVYYPVIDNTCWLFNNMDAITSNYEFIKIHAKAEQEMKLHLEGMK
jgi:hypothetical protein